MEEFNAQGDALKHTDQRLRIIVINSDGEVEARTLNDTPPLATSTPQSRSNASEEFERDLEIAEKNGTLGTDSDSETTQITTVSRRVDETDMQNRSGNTSRNEIAPRTVFTDRRPVRTRGVMFGGILPLPRDPILDPPPGACFRCREHGHTHHDCPKPPGDQYCFNCGRSFATLWTCVRCSSAHLKWLAEKYPGSVALKRGRTRSSTSTSSIAPLPPKIQACARTKAGTSASASSIAPNVPATPSTSADRATAAAQDLPPLVPVENATPAGGPARSRMLEGSNPPLGATPRESPELTGAPGVVNGHYRRPSPAEQVLRLSEALRAHPEEERALLTSLLKQLIDKEQNDAKK